MPKIKQVGWFRPIYYFAPPTASFVFVLLTAYMAHTKTNGIYLWLCVGAVATACIQLATAVREYKTWMFNFELKQVYDDYMKVIVNLQKL